MSALSEYGHVAYQPRARSRWGAIANPHAKVFDSPKHPQVPTRGMTLATEWKFCSICFLSFICENAHKVWYKIFEIDILMIFDLLTSPQGHQFDPKMKMLLEFCSARHPRRFDMSHDHIWKNKLSPSATPVPKSPRPGAWPRQQNKNPVWYVLYLSFIRTQT